MLSAAQFRRRAPSRFHRTGKSLSISSASVAPRETSFDVAEIDDVTAGYGQTEVLRGVTLKLRANEIFVLMGPNGSGKTTLIRVILGLMKPLRGEVRLRGGDGQFASRKNHPAGASGCSALSVHDCKRELHRFREIRRRELARGRQTRRSRAGIDGLYGPRLAASRSALGRIPPQGEHRGGARWRASVTRPRRADRRRRRRREGSDRPEPAGTERARPLHTDRHS